MQVFAVKFYFAVLFPITALMFVGCTTNSKKDRSPKFRQYYIQGERLYKKHCSNCHQENGAGLGRIYPPLDTSDYMNKNLDEVLCLMRHGKEGSILVNGVEYNKPMPGIESLNDLEIAEIATFIYNSWSHEKGLINVNEASVILQRCDSIDN